jgi:hypothetical protein
MHHMKSAINYIGERLPNCPDFPRFNLASPIPTGVVQASVQENTKKQPLKAQVDALTPYEKR